MRNIECEKLLGTYLSWKLQFFAFENLGDVEIEEVTVKDCLNAAGHNCDDIVETFPVVPEQIK